jgi:hypothetical protein
MQPLYLAEKRYSYHVFGWRKPVATDYQPADPQTQFELQVQALFVQGYGHLQNDELYLALQTFRQLQNLILTTVHPKLPADAYLSPNFVLPLDEELVDLFVNTVATKLSTLPLKHYVLPKGVDPGDGPLPDVIQKQLAPFETAGLTQSASQSLLHDGVAKGAGLAREGNWAAALDAFTTTLQQAANAPAEVQASLLHDMAILTEKVGKDRGAVMELAEKSASMFEEARQPEAQVQAMQTLSGVLVRGGEVDRAQSTLANAQTVFQKSNLFPVSVGGAPIVLDMTPSGAKGTAPHDIQVPPVAGAGAGATVSLQGVATSAQLLLDAYWQPAPQERSFTLAGAESSISLAGDPKANVTKYLQALTDTTDLKLVQPWTLSYVETVAYLPSMYFYAIPMAIGDCLVGLGNLAEAETTYRSALVYPFINRSYELVKLWTKLANVYLEQGDLAYRNARDDVVQYAAAKTTYEHIINTDQTLSATSALYANAKFATIKSRIQAFVTAGMPSTFADNPQMLSIVMEASLKLHQIQAGLDFFGLAPDYLPPFNWEYLQTTAKYFAQQASQIEQRYIQFKSQAENESLQRQQLDQQAEVARQTVVLEQRGLA